MYCKSSVWKTSFSSWIPNLLGLLFPVGSRLCVVLYQLHPSWHQRETRSDCPSGRGPGGLHAFSCLPCQPHFCLLLASLSLLHKLSGLKHLNVKHLEIKCSLAHLTFGKSAHPQRHTNSTVADSWLELCQQYWKWREVKELERYFQIESIQFGVGGDPVRGC